MKMVDPQRDSREYGFEYAKIFRINQNIGFEFLPI